MKTHVSYQLIAVVTGFILLGSTILGSAPMVFADNDHAEKLKKLKDLIKKWKDKKKCPDKKKYGDLCDKKKPRVDITFPEKRDRVSSPVTIMVAASDDLSGIKEVLVKINRGSYQSAIYDSDTDTWKLTVNLDDGRYFVFAKAIDWVGNSKRDFTWFTVN